MASTFKIELSMREAPAEAQARAATALTEPARAVGLRLTKRGASELGYKPRVQFPFLIMLYHNLNGEQMTVKFEPGGAGGTRRHDQREGRWGQPRACGGPRALVGSSRWLDLGLTGRPAGLAAVREQPLPPSPRIASPFASSRSSVQS